MAARALERIAPPVRSLHASESVEQRFDSSAAGGEGGQGYGGSHQLIAGRPGEGGGVPVPPVPDSRRFAKHMTGIIHSELMEIPGVVSQEMRLVTSSAQRGGPDHSCRDRRRLGELQPRQARGLPAAAGQNRPNRRADGDSADQPRHRRGVSGVTGRALRATAQRLAGGRQLARHPERDVRCGEFVARRVTIARYLPARRHPVPRAHRSGRRSVNRVVQFTDPLVPGRPEVEPRAGRAPSAR
jgi:hypothetical protein